MRGHVRQRGKGWVYVVELPKDAEGKRRQQWSGQYATKKAAEDGLAERLVQVSRGLGTNLERGTVGEYLDTWLAGRRRIRDSTALSYQSKLKTHVLPAIGSIRMDRLRSVDIEVMYRKAGVSDSTLRIIDALLRKALTDAYERGMIANNPMRHIERPRVVQPELQVWTPEQARAFLRVSDESRWAGFFRLSLATGMRRGEVLALRWSDVDLERGWVTVTRTLTPSADGFVVGEVKTASSRRRIRIDPAVVAGLRKQRVVVNELRLRVGGDWQDEGLIFPGKWGGVLNPNVVRYRLRQLAGEAGVPVIRVHDLRHTAATLMILAGIPLKMVSSILGHASLTMTGRYLHVIEEMEEGASEAIGRLLDTGVDDERGTRDSTG